MILSEEDVAHSAVIREEHKQSLISSLRRYPDFSWLLGRPNSGQDRLQGDFFKSFPVLFLKPDGSPLLANKMVMVLSNTCDIQAGRNEMAAVAPVFDVEKFLRSEREKAARSEEALSNYETSIKQNQINSLLYVPSVEGMESGAIVRLDMICSVASNHLESAIGAGCRVASFTQAGFYVLLMKLTQFLVRMESHEAVRH